MRNRIEPKKLNVIAIEAPPEEDKLGKALRAAIKELGEGHAVMLFSMTADSGGYVANVSREQAVPMIREWLGRQRVEDN